jgi:hypothetical protein
MQSHGSAALLAVARSSQAPPPGHDRDSSNDRDRDENNSNNDRRPQFTGALSSHANSNAADSPTHRPLMHSQSQPQSKLQPHLQSQGSRSGLGSGLTQQQKMQQLQQLQRPKSASITAAAAASAGERPPGLVRASLPVVPYTATALRPRPKSAGPALPSSVPSFGRRGNRDRASRVTIREADFSALSSHHLSMGRVYSSQNQMMEAVMS